MSRICLECEYFTFYPSEPGYSEVTPGCEARLYCDKGRWDMNNFGSREEYCKNMESAEQCRYFQMRESPTANREV